MKSKVLILSFSPSRREPRVMRQVRLLERDFEVTVVGHGDAPAAQVEFIPMAASNPAALPPTLKRWLKAVLGQFDPRRVPALVQLLAGRFEAHYWNQWDVQRALVLLAGRTFDLVIAHDIRVLPVALRVAGDAPVLYDAHEYAPRQNEDQLGWRLTTGRLYHHICARYLRAAAGMITVADGIAAEYRRVYGVQPLVVRNSPVLQSLHPRATGERIRLVHHGDASPTRRIEVYIEAMQHLDERFTLDLMLVGSDERYLQRLRDIASGDARIRFVPPVPMEDICRTINAYDIGLLCIPPVNFNQKHCLPNKVLEYVQARLAIATGPSPEVARMVEGCGLGVVSEAFDPAAFAAALRPLTAASVDAFKAAVDAAAPELSFERDADLLFAEVERLLLR